MKRIHKNLPKYIYRRAYHYVVIVPQNGESIYLGRAKELSDAEKILNDYLNDKKITYVETMETIARKEYKKVGDEQLFPNHSDKDIWINGFIKGAEYIKKRFKL